MTKLVSAKKHFVPILSQLGGRELRIPYCLIHVSDKVPILSQLGGRELPLRAVPRKLILLFQSSPSLEAGSYLNCLKGASHRQRVPILSQLGGRELLSSWV